MNPSFLTALTVLGVSLAGLSSCAEPQTRAHGKRLIVLGIDGMDPAFLERHWADLPNLARLRNEGSFVRLETTNPPQSPVAWATFVTGLPPRGHGIHDFVHRDARTYLPESSMSRTQPGRKLPIGPYLIPVTPDQIENRRRGTAFWQLLTQSGVAATILRMPTDFPPIECEAHSIAGMGTPDLLGTFGTFSFFTDRDEWKNRDLTGGRVIPVRVQDNRARLMLGGPANPLRKGEPAASLVMDVHIDPAEAAARFDVDGRLVVLKQGEESDWIPVRFPLISGMASTQGMIRITAKELRPNFSVYVSPINIDPRDPAIPISAPDSFGRELAESGAGSFFTQGIPYDTAALRHGVFTRAEYIRHSREVSRQTLQMFRAAFSRFNDGLLFFHFFGVDQDSHVLWGKHEAELLGSYAQADELLGWVRSHASDADVVVMSDHGFAAFDRSVHLNRWLAREGYLVFRDQQQGEHPENFAGVDWSRTRAYAVGLNGLYLNKSGREREGIVLDQDAGGLLAEIRGRLLLMRDDQRGQVVVRSVQFTNAGDASSPDALVGYAPGYRGSWQTALGATPRDVIEDNRDEWRGDHCIDPAAVSGVLLSNRKIAEPAPRIEDVTVTILRYFGVNQPAGATGRNLF